jgi:exopolysaccharide biosynthesis polyprenyl glycosylphosphotransferase
VGREGNRVEPRRSARRRAAVVWKTGRILAVVLPVVAVGFALPGHSWHQRIAAVAILTPIWAVSIGIGNAVSRPSLTALGPEVAICRGVLVAVAASTAVAAWLPAEQLSLAAIGFLALTVFLAAGIWELFALRKLKPAVRLLLVGEIADAEALLQDLPRDGGYELIGVVGAEDDLDYPDPQVLLPGPLPQLASVIAEHQPDLVILSDGRRTPETISSLLDAAEAGFRVLEFAEFYEYAFGRVPIDDVSHDWFLSVLHIYQHRYSRAVKRGLDLVGASLLLILTLPLFPLLAVFVLQTEGSLIFRQSRLGEHGRLFTIYKFRTMRADAEAAGAAVWASADDPRLTRAGAVIRQLRLDELPQLWNVLRGEMSLVGPRPERPEFLEELSDRVPFWTRRHLMKPGLTGWAQVRQGYAASTEETATKLSFDLWYLRHRSLTVDLAILMRTLAVVLRGDMSGGRSSAPASRDAYAELRDRALTALGSGGSPVVTLPVTSLAQEASRSGEAEASGGHG